MKLGLFVLDFLTDRVLGISFLQGSKKDRAEAARSYEKSAHILKVVTRGTINLAAYHDESNFLYFHHSYIHPKYILENKHVCSTLHKPCMSTTRVRICFQFQLDVFTHCEKSCVFN